jgi:hypothetical protein
MVHMCDGKIRSTVEMRCKTTGCGAVTRVKLIAFCMQQLEQERIYARNTSHHTCGYSPQYTELTLAMLMSEVRKHATGENSKASST